MKLRDLTEPEAELVTTRGWLSRQPPAFQAEVLRCGVVQSVASGEAVYHLGDPSGGIYGIVQGRMTVTTAPGMTMPRLIHVAGPGTWTGEGPFLTGEPRRLTLRAASDSRCLHLPMEVMEAMVARDPSAMRRFAEIPVLNVDTLMRVIHDLLIRDADRRIGAVLLRVAPGEAPLPLSQEELGDMACATRKQVNFALRRFAERGWICHAYRSVTLRDAAAMRVFVAAEDEG